MSQAPFFHQLAEATADERRHLLDAPLIHKALNRQITLEEYVAFLTQAYHHVKHTVPLLMAAGARIPAEKEWLREAIADYIEEEIGHQEWILDDIAACGFDREAARSTEPGPATELMVAYAYDMILRVNPVGFFGMVYVLEGTSTSVAATAANEIRAHLKLPDSALSYLTSHGSLDLEHMAFFEKLMNRVEDPVDRKQIIHCAQMFFRLYGDIFRTLPRPDFVCRAA